MNHHGNQRRLLEIWLRANEGAASDDEVRRLNDALETDAQFRDEIIALASQQGWLAWQGAMQPAVSDAGCARQCQVRIGAADDSQEAADGQLSESAPIAAAVKFPVSRASAVAREAIGRLAGIASRWAQSPLYSRSRLASLIALLACVAGGMYWMGGRQTSRSEQNAALQTPASVNARLVGSTLCVWDASGMVRPHVGRQLRDGESLHLIEGIAELSLHSQGLDARVLLEGPAALVLASQGVPSLRYGKITVETTGPRESSLAVETSFGRILLTAGSEIGVSAFGSSAEVHVFRGNAVIESPWLASIEGEKAIKAVDQGSAVYLDNVGGAVLHLACARANRMRFTPQISMDADYLAVDSRYVAAVRQDAPLAYWRFERSEAASGADDMLVRNEMGDFLHGELRGQVRWVGPPGNQAIEFGLAPDPGSMVVSHSSARRQTNQAAGDWDEVLDGDFTLEAWIKPSHYHHGSIMGFVGEFDWESRRNEYGVLLEVAGPLNPTSVHQPERLRFLYRTKLGHLGGVSCFSEHPYQPRRWQHVAAVRQGEQLHVYLNGKLSHTAVIATKMPLGLQLVMGQLYTETVERFFIGHVDEVAIYDRALKESEVGRHYQILRGDRDPDRQLELKRQI